MRNISNNAENFKPACRLCCVWRAIREGESTRLVARWIDPQAGDREKAESEEYSVEGETSGRCPGIDLRAA